VSIVKTRTFLEKSGCAKWVSLIIGAVFVVGIFAFGGGGARGGRGDDPKAFVVFEMGGLTVSRGVLLTLGTTQSQPENLPIDQEIGRTMSNLQSLVQSGYAFAAAQELGISVGDAEVKAGMQEEKDRLLEAYASGGVKKQTVDEFRNSPEGKRLIQILTDQFGQFDKVPNGQEYLRAYFSQAALTNYFKKSLSPSDEEVKHGDDQLMLRAIYLSPTQGEAAFNKKVDEIGAEVKKDGFLTVAAKYAKTPSTGIMAPATPFPMLRSQVVSSKETRKLAELKAGETSDAVSTGTFGKAIFYLVEINDGTPKDFELKKAEYRQKYIDVIVRGAVQSAIEKQKAATKIEWKDKAYEALYSLSTVQPSYENYVTIFRQAAAAEKADGADARAAIYAKYEAMKNAWQVATPKQKKDFSGDRAATLGEVLDFTEDFTMRMDLVDLYIELRKGPEAMGVLDAGASAAQSADEFDKIELRGKKLLAENLIAAKDLDSLKVAKKRWLEEKAIQAKQDAEFAKKEAEIKKKTDEQARQFDEAKKKADAERAAKEKASGGKSTPEPSNGK
jgi:hypothetical protein